MVSDVWSGTDCREFFLILMIRISYLKELPLDEAAKVLSYMDSDDAADNFR